MKPAEISWIIMLSKDKGTEYGIGSFIRYLAHGLSEYPQICVYILEVGTIEKLEHEIVRNQNITYIKIPFPYNNAYDINSVKYQRKLAKRITCIAKENIPLNKSHVLHLNSVFHYYVGEAFQKEFNSIILYTQHLFIYENTDRSQEPGIEEYTAKLARHIVAVTNHGKDHLIRKRFSFEKISVIHNGLDPAALTLKTNKDNLLRKYGLSANDRIILYSGRIDLIKGLEYLSKAFHKVLKSNLNCRLVIAGNGDFESLMKYTSIFSSNVSFLGFIPYPDILGFYACAYIGVIPSLEEHCSYVALEMLHCGLPVVASDTGGLREIFQHKKDALLVKMNEVNTNFFKREPDIDSLAESIIFLLNNEKVRDKLAENAQIKAKNTFTSGIMVEKYVQLIKDKIVID